MYRLLIVDDEPVFIDGLCNIFQEAKHLDLDICKASSGIEAMEVLSRIYIDIVITDIKMPGVNGLQLLDHIMKRWPSCRIIMLTGYDEFDYVYHAIQYKGVNYLLKTEGFDKIIRAVEDSIEDIEQNKRNNEMMAKTASMLKSILPLMQKEVIHNIIRGHFEELMQQRFDELEIPLKIDEPVYILLGNFGHPDNAAIVSSIEIGYRMKLILDQYLEESIRSVNIPLEGDKLLWLIQPKVDTVKLDEEEGVAGSYDTASCNIIRVLETVQSFCRETMEMRVSFAFEREPIQLNEVAEKYARLDYLLNSGLDPNAEILITDAEASAVEFNDKTHALWATDHIFSKFEALGLFLEKGMKDDFDSLFSSMQTQLYRLCSGEYTRVLEVYSRIALFFIAHINRFGLMESLAPEAEASRLFRVDRLGTWDEAFLFFHRTAHFIFEVHISESSKRSAEAVLKIKNYIDSHLSSDLSLAGLSNQVYFSPKYLSKLFKQVTGMNLLGYINELKISKIKELLSEKDSKINEIGVQVGFLSAPYFTRFFKKATGMTPQEYRSWINNNQENAENP
jgi:two-component system response regulator YesN